MGTVTKKRLRKAVVISEQSELLSCGAHTLQLSFRRDMLSRDIIGKSEAPNLFPFVNHFALNIFRQI